LKLNVIISSIKIKFFIIKLKKKLSIFIIIGGIFQTILA